MKKGAIIAIIIVAIIVVGAIVYMAIKPSAPSSPPGPPDHLPSESQVSIANFAFSPSTATIKAGDSVTWTNGDSMEHTVTFDSSDVISSGSLSPGATFSQTFQNPGTYTYHCSIHPSMKGTIVVQ